MYIGLRMMGSRLDVTPWAFRTVQQLPTAAYLKECTEKFWRVADDKAYNATHVLGCVNGIVVEVIKVNRVLLAEDAEYKGRKIFDGIEEPASPYIDVNIRCIFDTLANFNTKYYNL